MPKSTLSDVPFDSRYGETRVCPRCDIEKAVEPEFWPGRWEWVTEEADDLTGTVTRRKARRPTVYCRECTNTAKRNNRLVRRILDSVSEDPALYAEWSAEHRGPCGVCGAVSNKRAAVPRWDLPWVLCSQCNILLLEADRMAPEDPIAYTFAQWRPLAKHLADERRIQSEMIERTDRDYVPHLFNPEMRGVTYPHGACRSLELSWRKLHQWLKSNEPPEPFAA